MVDKPHILVADHIAASGVAILQANPSVEVTVKTGLSVDQLRLLLPSYQGLIVRSATRVTADMLEAATDLKIIGRAGIGVDNIDVEAATRRGIVKVGLDTIVTANQQNLVGLCPSRCGYRQHPN